MPNADHLLLLIACLAASESPWLPIRRNWDQAAAIHVRRRGDVSDLAADRNRMRRLRQRALLVDRGLLDGHYRLTGIGKRLTRSLCWPFTQSELRTALIRLTDALCRGDYVRHEDTLLVPEQFIAGEFWGRQVGCLQWLFLPLLADRVLGSRSTPDGRVFYLLRGDADLANVAANIIREDIELRDSACRLYDDEFNRCRDRMLDDGTYYSDLGECPVPARELKSGRGDDDLTGITPLFHTSEKPNHVTSEN